MNRVSGQWGRVAGKAASLGTRSARPRCLHDLKANDDMKRMFLTHFITWALASVTFTASAATSTSAIPRIERLALFKNGLGYVTATATLPPNTTSVRIGQLPVPAYGTFWVGYPQDVKLRTLTTAMETVDELVPVSGVDQLLRLNPGRKVVLHTAGTAPGEPGVVAGVLQPLGELPAVTEPPSPYFMDFRRGPERPYYSGYPAAAQTSIVLVKTDQGMVALSPGAVQRVDFEGGEPICVTTNQQKRPSIRMELEAAAGGAKTSVAYLARGITWVPSYRLDLSDERTARFSAQAQVMNELADLEDVHVDLVTGFPNAQFADLPNPVAMSQSLADFLKSLAAGRAEGTERGYLMQQQRIDLSNSANFANYETAPLPSYSTMFSGQTAEDLFLYPLSRVSLRRGETATIPLFTTDMPYRHLYTWKIGDPLEGESSRPRGDGKSAEEVWHVCRLVNAAKMPLTTAAAEFVKDGQFVGQDTCFYTAAGAEASIRINRALNVQAEQAEVEVERKRNAANFYGYGYDLVKLTGELKIRNRLGKPIDMEITKELSGEVLDKSAEAKDVPTGRGLKQVNPKHVLTWMSGLKAGDELKITYSYQLYIRP
jgi:hypothetical protein